jgi:2-methylfumaryl-CoA hydratase
MTSPHGRFFEDFTVGETLAHATPRTLTQGDAAVYMSIFGSCFALHCSQPVAQALGYSQMPLDDMLVFHTVFGKSVPDISLNAVANLGYAQGRFLHPVYAGDTLHAQSTVLGLRLTSKGDAGIVAVRTQGINQHGTVVLDYCRQVMVQRRTTDALTLPPMPELESVVAADSLVVPEFLNMQHYNNAAMGSAQRWHDYSIGQHIQHVDGITIEEAEHQMATRLYQNTARVHFNAHQAQQSRFGKRLVYGGHVMSIARALSHNGLANAFAIAAINGGKHVAPVFAGDTIYASTQILNKAATTHPQVGALRLNTVASKNAPNGDVVLEWDYWVLMPL